MLRVFRFAFLVASLSTVASTKVDAQFGHPLKGSWSGDWGVNANNRTHVVLDINWDGKALTTALNPGPNAIPLKTTLEPSTWMVHLEGDGKDGRIVIDGKVENIGAYQRFITGTWAEGSKKGHFKVTRT